MSSFPCNSFGDNTGGFGEGGFGEGGFGAGSTGLGPIAYYLSLVTSQYQNSSKFLQWLTAALNIYSDAMQCLCNLDASFDLDNAVGKQLDILGQLIGEDRTVGFQPLGGVSPILDDGTYRLLIRAKIAQNQWDGQLHSLYAIWQQLFPGGVIALQDNQNMTATIFITGSFSSITRDLIINGYIVPRPETVQYTFVFGTLPTFGFDQNNAFVAGFDLGHLA